MDGVGIMPLARDWEICKLDELCMCALRRTYATEAAHLLESDFSGESVTGSKTGKSRLGASPLRGRRSVGPSWAPGIARNA